MTRGAHGNSFLKKALNRVKPTEKRKCRICKKGAEGANSEAWNVQFGPRSPRPCSAPLVFQAGRKNTDEEKALPAWEGEMIRQQRKALQPDARGETHLQGWGGRFRKMDVPVPVYAPPT